MTATSPVSSPTSSHSTHSSPACLPACTRHLKKGPDLQTKLHLRSAPGVWLLLGVFVVLVGMSVAVAGYVTTTPRPVGGRGSTHAERMKLTGPVVMGVGLFIFICAATLLYENRDRRLRRQEAADDLEGLKGGNSWEDTLEQPSWEGRGEEQRFWAVQAHTLPLSNQNLVPLLPPPSLPPPHRHIGASRPSLMPSVDAGCLDKQKLDRREETEVVGRSTSTLLAQVLHHQEPSPLPGSPGLSVSNSSIYSDTFNSSEVHFNIRTDPPPPPQP